MWISKVSEQNKQLNDSKLKGSNINTGKIAFYLLTIFQFINKAEKKLTKFNIVQSDGRTDYRAEISTASKGGEGRGPSD